MEDHQSIFSPPPILTISRQGLYSINENDLAPAEPFITIICICGGLVGVTARLAACILVSTERGEERDKRVRTQVLADGLVNGL